ncbi:hypothetical protein [Burkholderia sp. 9120]|uniref:hypothetical protein n=1 Tax=Burkholderia sp. 9120 TaxID=1500897 RepID=UPI000A54E462|nr:hypothetical protein [Burkholderia sp. 9120]
MSLVRFRRIQNREGSNHETAEISRGMFGREEQCTVTIAFCRERQLREIHSIWKIL